MKKLNLLMLLFLIITVTQLISCKGFFEKKLSINNDTSEQYPLIFFENPDFNFGKIFAGQKVEHTYKFENRGNGVLKIKKVKSSCGCTAAILTNKTILPGETGEVIAAFSSGPYMGKVVKSITVKSNDPGKSSYKLTLSGEITQLISAKPRHINFGSVYVGREINKMVAITSNSNFKTKTITTSRPFVNASIEVEDNYGCTIKVGLKNSLEIGRFNGFINLETNIPGQQNVRIPFFGEIIGDITTYPNKIYYGNVKKGKEIIQRVLVRLNKENIEILDIKVSPDCLSAKIIENHKKNDSQYLIEVKLHEDAAIGKLNGLLEMKTNSEMQPNIEVPIAGEIT